MKFRIPMQFLWEIVNAWNWPTAKKELTFTIQKGNVLKAKIIEIEDPKGQIRSVVDFEYNPGN